MRLLNFEQLSRRCELPECSQRRTRWRAWLDPAVGYTLHGHWYCSVECLEQALKVAIIAALPGNAPEQPAPHRVPLGLLMLSRGMVDGEQLKKALKAQKESGSGRVGEWLRHMGIVNEEQVTQVLGLQWSVPVFPLGKSQRYTEYAHLVPLPLLEVAVMVPVHHVANTQSLYIAFVDRINYSALVAVEKVLECHTEPCVALQSQVLSALNELRRRPGPIEMVAGVGTPADIAAVISTRCMEHGVTGVKVSGFDGCVWARLSSPAGHTDLIFNRTASLEDATRQTEVLPPPPSVIEP